MSQSAKADVSDGKKEHDAEAGAKTVGETPVPPSTKANGASMSVKELKKALEAIGVSYAGCTEKKQLVDLLEKVAVSATESASEPVDCGSVPVLEVDPRYASFEIVRKEDELEDKNFPPNMTAAIELFGLTGLDANLQKCKKRVDRFLSVLEKGPDGVTNHAIGKGCICWECGHVGIAKNAEACTSTSKVLPKCADCGSDSQTNFVNAHQHDGTILPWIEVNEEQTAAAQKAAAMGKVGRNDPCPCGNGKKYKKCCGAAGSGAAGGGGEEGEER